MIVNWLKKKKKGPQIQWSSYCTWDQHSKKRRIVGYEAEEEGSIPCSTTKCWITCPQASSFNSLGSSFVTREMYLQGACVQGPGFWVLVGVDDYQIGTMPHLLKRAIAPKACLFQSVGKGSIPRKAIYLEDLFWGAGLLHHTVPSWCRSVGKTMSASNNGQS